MMHANNSSFNNRRNVNDNVEDGFVTSSTSNEGYGSTGAAVLMNNWSNTSSTAASNSSSC